MVGAPTGRRPLLQAAAYCGACVVVVDEDEVVVEAGGAGGVTFTEEDLLSRTVPFGSL